MPYRNVYEERRSIRESGSEEPERDPKKIAEIYRRQLPDVGEVDATIQNIQKNKERIKEARVLKRGIGKRTSILDLP